MYFGGRRVLSSSSLDHALALIIRAGPEVCERDTAPSCARPHALVTERVLPYMVVGLYVAFIFIMILIHRTIVVGHRTLENGLCSLSRELTKMYIRESLTALMVFTSKRLKAATAVTRSGSLMHRW